MTYDTVLAALGDSTRRRVLERLRGGPLSVGEIARDLPVSRPAVSQHLRVLREAGLVAERGQGTRRIYTIAIEGVSAARDYLDTLATGQAARPAARRGNRAATSAAAEPQAAATEAVREPQSGTPAPEHAKGKDGRAKAGKSGKGPKAARAAADKPAKAEKPARTDKSAAAAATGATEREPQPDKSDKPEKSGKPGKGGKSGKGGKGGKARNADR